jgi:ribosomal protein S11
MPKPKKNLNSKNKYKERKKKKALVGKRLKIRIRVRKVLRKTSNFLNPQFQKFKSISQERLLLEKLSIRITPNNVFCTLKNLKTGKTLLVGSSGKYKIKISKKNLRFTYKIIVGSFLKEIKRKMKKSKLLVSIIGPIRIRKALVKQIVKVLPKKKQLIINVDAKKCFNGCRPQKKRRKKQRGLRIFK